MKWLKMLALLAIAAAALMVFGSTASATSTEGTGDYVDAGDPFHAVNEGSVIFHSPAAMTCSTSTLNGAFNQKGGTTISLSVASFTECEKDTLNVVAAGSLSIASNGTVTSTGLEFTTQTHRSLFGFPITTHCVYRTNATHIGTLTESSREASKPTATLHVSATIPEVPTDSACDDVQLTASYKVVTPDYLDIH